MRQVLQGISIMILGFMSLQPPRVGRPWDCKAFVEEEYHMEPLRFWPWLLPLLRASLARLQMDSNDVSSGEVSNNSSLPNN